MPPQLDARLLEKALGDKDPETRLYALWALALVGDPASAPRVRPLLDSEGKVVGINFAALRNAQGVFFAIPINATLDDSAQEVVELGDLGYWPPGKAFCIFFGQTPASQPGKIMPASAVNVIGEVLGDATQFKTVMREREVVLEAR